jgi:uncharacterized damage-inducible protein DinB
MKPFFLFALLLVTGGAYAQSPLSDQLKQQMIKDWQRAKEYTDSYLEAMPADKYSFRPTDSIRSFAQQMLHLSVANVGLVSIATGLKDTTIMKVYFFGDLEKRSSAQTRDSVAYFVNRSYDFVMSTLQALDFNTMDQVVTQQMPNGLRTEPRLAWLLKAFEHQTHHRGQCTIYIRLAGVHPPPEKLF